RGWIVSRERLSAIEEKLRQIHGVVSARIRAREDEAWEVHALVTADTDSVRAQIRSAPFAGLGVELDLDRINLVEVAREGEPVGNRILFHSVNVYREGNRAEAQVELRRDGASFIGTASGPPIRHGLPRMVARATLEAIRQIAGEDLALELLAVELRRLGGRRLVLSHLVLLRGREETLLTGSVLVTRDPYEAVVFSLLDALNRVIPTLESEVIEFE